MASVRVRVERNSFASSALWAGLSSSNWREVEVEVEGVGRISRGRKTRCV